MTLSKIYLDLPKSVKLMLLKTQNIYSLWKILVRCFFSTHHHLQIWQKKSFTTHNQSPPITNHRQQQRHKLPDSPFYKALVPGLECNGKPLMRRRLVGLGVVVGCREGWLRRDGSGCCCCCCCVFYGEFLFRPEIPLLNILRHRILVQIEIDIYLALYPTQKHGSVENGG